MRLLSSQPVPGRPDDRTGRNHSGKPGQAPHPPQERDATDHPAPIPSGGRSKRGVEEEQRQQQARDGKGDGEGENGAEVKEDQRQRPAALERRAEGDPKGEEFQIERPGHEGPGQEGVRDDPAAQHALGMRLHQPAGDVGAERAGEKALCWPAAIW